MKLDRRAAGVFIAGWSNFLNLYTPQAILPKLAADLGASQAGIGLAITVTLLAVALIAPVAGAISDRLGRKRVILAAMFALVVPTLLVAAAGSLPQLLLWRTIQGMLLPFIFAVTVAYVGDECTGAEAIKVAGVYSSGTIFGGFSGRFIAGIVSDLSGWRMAFVVLAVITLASAAFVAWAMPPEQRFRPTQGGLASTLRAYAQHLRNRRLLGTCVVGFGMLFCVVTTFTYINFVLSAAPFFLSTSQLGTLFAVYLLGMVTTPMMTRLAVRVGRRPTIAGAMALAMGGAALTTAASLGLIVAGLALIVVGVFTAQALATGFIGVAARQARSSAVGLYVTIFYTGGALGGILPGWFWRHGGWPGVVGLMLAVMAVMLAAALSAWREPV